MLPWCARALFLVSLASTAAGTSAASIDTEVSVPVQVVTAKSIEESPTCGRVLSDLVNIAPAPMLNIGRSTLTLPAGTDPATLIDNLQIRTSDGKLHPASSPICVEDIQVLKGPAEAIYGSDSVAGVINFVTSPYSGPKPLDSFDYSSNFFAEPFLNPGQVQIIRGPFDARWPGTSVDVNGKPGLVLAETPQALFWLLPDDAPSGSVSMTVTDAGRGARFPVYILGLAMSADRLKLLRGQSTRMQATVFGPELIPADQWKAGDMSWTLDLKKIGQLFPDFKIPRPGEPASLFFRVDNVSRDTVTMKPSKNESFIVNLNRSNFASGPYTYGATIQSKKAGGFTINGLVVGFFAPIPGEPLPPPSSSATSTASDPGTGTATAPSTGSPAQVASQPEPVSCPQADDCTELRRRWERLQQELTEARQSQPGAADGLARQHEAAMLNESAASDRAYAAKLREQAAKYRALAESNRSQAATNRRRAAESSRSDWKAGWEAEAARNVADAARYDADAGRLSAQADALDAKAAGNAARASELAQGVDAGATRGLDEKQKAADEALAAYNACLNKIANTCVFDTTKYSISAGLTYKWSAGVTYTPYEPASETASSTPEPTRSSRNEEPQCVSRLLDGWLAPSQGVWQDDMLFEDRPGKQLTRVDVPDRVSYIAELPMIRGRDTVIAGVHHYLRAGKRVDVRERESVVFKGETNCTEYESVRVKFTISGPGQGGEYVVPDTYHIKLRGKPQQSMEAFEVRAFSSTGFPLDRTFKFGSTGPYLLQADLVKLDGGPTGLFMRVSGQVVQTTGPQVTFAPAVLSPGASAAALDAAAQRLASDSAKYIPDLFPIAAGGLPAKADPVKDLTSLNIPDVWDFGIFYRKETKLVAALQDRLGAAAFLTGAGRVIALLDPADFRTVEGTGVAGRAASDELSFKEQGLTLSYKVIVMPRTEGVDTAAHELVHTLPGLWSSSQMVAECGVDYHNKGDYWASGIRLTAGGQAGDRRLKDRVAQIMGPAVHDVEPLEAPFTGYGSPERDVPGTNGGTERRRFTETWISQCTYSHLAQVLQQPPDPPMLLVRGYLGRRDGKYSAHLNAFYDVMGHEDLPPGFIGDFAIVLKNAAGATLGTYRFVADWLLPGQTLTRDLVAFHYRVPMLPELAQIDLVGPDGPLASRRLSPAPPEVSLAGGGLAVRDGRAHVNWSTRGGAAAGPLLSTVLYSADDGKTWSERVFETTGTSAVVDLPQGVRQHAVKLIVTDGSRSAEAVSRFTTQ